LKKFQVEIHKEQVKSRETLLEIKYDLQRDNTKLKTYIDDKIVEKYKSTDQTVIRIREQCEEKI
jgi:hypothetical protein